MKVLFFVGDGLSQCSPVAPGLQLGYLEPVHEPLLGVCSQDQGLCACYPTDGWSRLLWGPLVYGADDRTKAKQAIAESSGIQSR